MNTPAEPHLEPVVLGISGQLAGHVAVAIRRHREWALGIGMPLPRGLEQLEALFTSSATRGQRGTPLADLWDLRDAGDVQPRLLTYAQVAKTLACSERAVKRLIAAGALPAVRVGGGLARVRIADLDRYVAALSPTREGAA